MAETHQVYEFGPNGETLFGIPISGLGYRNIVRNELKNYTGRLRAIECCEPCRAIINHNYTMCNICLVNNIISLNYGKAKGVQILIRFVNTGGGDDTNIQLFPFLGEIRISLHNGIYINDIPVAKGQFKINKNYDPVLEIEGKTLYGSEFVGYLTGKYVCESLWHGINCLGNNLPHWKIDLSVGRYDRIFAERYCCNCAMKMNSIVYEKPKQLNVTPKDETLEQLKKALMRYDELLKKYNILENENRQMKAERVNLEYKYKETLDLCSRLKLQADIRKFDSKNNKNLKFLEPSGKNKELKIDKTGDTLRHSQ